MSLEMPTPAFSDLKKATPDELREEILLLRLFVSCLYREYQAFVARDAFLREAWKRIEELEENRVDSRTLFKRIEELEQKMRLLEIKEQWR